MTMHIRSKTKYKPFLKMLNLLNLSKKNYFYFSEIPAPAFGIKYIYIGRNNVINLLCCMYIHMCTSQAKHNLFFYHDRWDEVAEWMTACTSSGFLTFSSLHHKLQPS